MIQSDGTTIMKPFQSKTHTKSTKANGPNKTKTDSKHTQNKHKKIHLQPSKEVPNKHILSTGHIKA